MSLRLRAHFDGRVFVPDEPVDLPLNQPLELEVRPEAVKSTNGTSSPEAVRERLRKLEEFFRLPTLGELPPGALRRENLYEERM
jgi:hypothetical protein